MCFVDFETGVVFERSWPIVTTNWVLGVFGLRHLNGNDLKRSAASFWFAGLRIADDVVLLASSVCSFQL